MCYFGHGFGVGAGDGVGVGAGLFTTMTKGSIFIAAIICVLLPNSEWELIIFSELLISFLTE